MAFNNQFKDMSCYLLDAKTERAALIERLRNLDQDIAKTQSLLNETWATRFEQPVVESDDESDDEDLDCSLRKRQTKKIGKGCVTKHCKRKASRDYRDKSRCKTARARKKTVRSPVENLTACSDCKRLSCACADSPDMTLLPDTSFEKADVDWVEKLNSELLQLTRKW